MGNVNLIQRLTNIRLLMHEKKFPLIFYERKGRNSLQQTITF